MAVDITQLVKAPEDVILRFNRKKKDAKGALTYEKTFHMRLMDAAAYKLQLSAATDESGDTLRKLILYLIPDMTDEQYDQMSMVQTSIIIANSYQDATDLITLIEKKGLSLMEWALNPSIIQQDSSL